MEEECWAVFLSWFWTGPASAVAGISGSGPVDGTALFLSASQINKQFFKKELEDVQSVSLYTVSSTSLGN